MELRKFTGVRAASHKYDILTALGVLGLHAKPVVQTSTMRLTCLITARYNWRLDEVTCGHQELAKLWGVDKRTVKREMKRLQDSGLLLCLRPGVRGRVGAYRLNYTQVYSLSRAYWPCVGSDFVDRMEQLTGPSTIVRVDFTQTPAQQPSQPMAQPGTWGAVCQRLKLADPALYESWFAKLRKVSLSPDRLVLETPNTFVARYIETHLSARLTSAVLQELGPEVQVILRPEASDLQ